MSTNRGQVVVPSAIRRRGWTGGKAAKRLIVRLSFGDEFKSLRCHYGVLGRNFLVLVWRKKMGKEFRVDEGTGAAGSELKDPGCNEMPGLLVKADLAGRDKPPV